ncbi:hypothetical protein Tco_0820890 [Tanacetum coccineum]|uniref:Uncharacterized protein n=1 Tax=Tanacetum coccineum TaxID=301880 RepID=A0ABQ5AAQ3_9ASTR
MHNNIMAAGSKDRPPMLGPGRYSQWRLRFLRYIDMKPNGGGLRKSILSGPYVPSTILVKVVAATDDDDDDVDSDADGDNEAKRNEEEYVRTPDSFEFNDDDEEYEELYKDVNVRLTDTEHEEQGKEDEEMTDGGRDDGTQQTKYEQVKDDENTPPLLNIPVMLILKTSTAAGSTIPPTISPITPLQQQSTPTPTPAPTTATTTTSVPDLPDFSSLFGFDQRSQIPTMVDAQLSTRLEDSIKKSFKSCTAEFEKKDKDERKRYIDLVEKSVKDIVRSHES